MSKLLSNATAERLDATLRRVEELLRGGDAPQTRRGVPGDFPIQMLEVWTGTTVTVDRVLLYRCTTMYTSSWQSGVFAQLDWRSNGGDCWLAADTLLEPSKHVLPAIAPALTIFRRGILVATRPDNGDPVFYPLSPIETGLAITNVAIAANGTGFGVIQEVSLGLLVASGMTVAINNPWPYPIPRGTQVSVLRDAYTGDFFVAEPVGLTEVDAKDRTTCTNPNTGVGLVNLQRWQTTNTYYNGVLVKQGSTWVMVEDFPCYPCCFSGSGSFPSGPVCCTGSGSAPSGYSVTISGITGVIPDNAPRGPCTADCSAFNGTWVLGYHGFGGAVEYGQGCGNQYAGCGWGNACTLTAADGIVFTYSVFFFTADFCTITWYQDAYGITVAPGQMVLVLSAPYGTGASPTTGTTLAIYLGPTSGGVGTLPTCGQSMTMTLAYTNDSYGATCANFPATLTVNPYYGTPVQYGTCAAGGTHCSGSSGSSGSTGSSSSGNYWCVCGTGACATTNGQCLPEWMLSGSLVLGGTVTWLSGATPCTGTITGGPFANDSSCAGGCAACGSGSSCSGVPGGAPGNCCGCLPNTIHITFGDGLSDLGTVACTYSSFSGSWVGSVPGGDACSEHNNISISIQCSGGQWFVLVTANTAEGQMTAEATTTSYTCSPLSFSVSGTIGYNYLGGPCNGEPWSATVTL